MASGSDIGVLFTPGGEQLTLVDATGHVLSDHEVLLCLITLRGPTLEGARVAVPVSATQAATNLTNSRDGSMVITPTSTAAIMAAAADPFVCVAADVNGRFIVPAFMPAFDAAATFVSVLELMASADLGLAEVVADLPTVHMAERSVVTPWDQKGSVMRELVEQSKDRNVDLVDGVRIHHDEGWVLVLPDVDLPVTRVMSEGSSPSYADRLVDEYVRRIEQLVRA